jgi:hypothetical protein
MVYKAEQALDQSGRLRIGQVTESPFRDRWWLVDPRKFDPKNPDDFFTEFDPGWREPTPEDECLRRIPVLVEHAFGLLASYAVPFWKDVARRRGLESEV